MSINLDSSLIHKFRNKVNEKSIFRSVYKNIGGKNHWNIICSCMDWIDVTTEGLPAIELKYKNGLGTNHLDSMNLMQYIVAIDIMVEAIMQLFRVLDSNKSYPLKNDHSIFKQRKISDDRFFKHIRAVFGTHQVNLDSLDGIKKVDGERFYASWPAKGVMKDNDYIVYLYSNNPERDNLNEFGLRISDINEYAEKRYWLLEVLIQKVEFYLNEHHNNNVNKLIHLNNAPTMQIEILIRENENRFGEGYAYSEELDHIRRLLNAKENTSETLINNIVLGYKNHLIEQITIIKSSIEEMKDVNLIHWTWNAYGYEFEKIYSYLYDYHPLGERYFEELLMNGSLPSYLFDVYDKDEKELVFESVLFNIANKYKRKITYKDMMNERLFS